MVSKSKRSPTHVGRVVVGVVLALLSMAIFAGLEAWGAEGPATPVAAAALTAADSGSERGALHTFDLATLGREAVKVMASMITAVFEGWLQPVDATLDWVDGIRRGWTAVHRFPGPDAPRS